MEYYDSEITTLIFDYCLSKDYNIDGFPKKYLNLIENDDEDFYDFLSFDVKYYYGLRNSLLHNDGFLLFKVYFNNPEISDYTNENCKEDILTSIEILNKENIGLVFNRADFNTSESTNNYKPKLP